MSGRSRQRRPERRILAAAILCAALCPGAAEACTATLGPLQTSPIPYDPFTLGGVDGSLSVPVQLNDGDRCTVVVTLSDGLGAPLRDLVFRSGDRAVVLRAELRESAAVRSSGSPESVRVTLGPEAPRATISWRLLSSSDAVMPPGDALLDVVADLSPTPGAAPSRGTLVLRSLPRAQVNIAGSAGAFASGSDAYTLDFGELRTGAQRQAVLQVRANVPAHLSFTSVNRGYLVQDASAAARVPYAIQFDGSPLNLAAGDHRDVTTPLSVNGAAYPLVVTIGDVRGALSGRYSDTVSIDVSP